MTKLYSRFNFQLSSAAHCLSLSNIQTPFINPTPTFRTPATPIVTFSIYRRVEEGEGRYGGAHGERGEAT